MILPIELGKPDVVADQKTAPHAVHFKGDEMIAGRVAFQIPAGAKAFVVAIDDLSIQADHIK